MKIILKIIYKKKLNYLLLILILLMYSYNLFSSENRIIFKINNNAFTSLDLEKRLEYLDFVGSNQDIDQNIIIEDFISANIFYEYFKNSANKNNYDDKINEILNEILNINKKNNKKYNYQINKENIYDNIKIDYIRKIVLESIFNSSSNNLNNSSEEIDLLYNINVKYVNLKTIEFNKLKNEISDFDKSDYKTIITYLDKNDFDYFAKEKEINNINKVDKRIRQNILLNKSFFIIEKDHMKSLIFIEKSFETLDGIIADLYSVKSKDELDNISLKCENLVKIKDNQNVVNKEYKLIDLNNNLKKNLIIVNDYVKYLSEDYNVYIVLCNIKFDKEILNSINFNKIINLNISKIEEKFINKYSKIYKLIKFDE